MIRLDNLPLDKTKALMAQVMPHVKLGHRVMFLTHDGDGLAMVARIRVMMSRARKKMKRQGKKMVHFSLHHSVNPWTENGKRHDCVILWSSRSDSHKINELLEEVFLDG